MTMFIRELAQQTGVTTKAIRHYESIGLLLPPQRAKNNYRIYSEDTVERLRFIAAARVLDFSLADIAEFFEARDNNQLPCQRILMSLDQHLAEIGRRIADLLTLRETLHGIQREAKNLPSDNNQCDEQCVCYLLTVNRENGQIIIQKENAPNEDIC